MKDFQSVVQNVLSRSEQHRRYVAFLTVLCLLMSFTVSMILIEPAESQTGALVCGYDEHVHSEECLSVISDEDGEEYLVLDCGLQEHEHSQGCYAALEEEQELPSVMPLNSSDIRLLAADVNEYFESPMKPADLDKLNADNFGDNIDRVEVSSPDNQDISVEVDKENKNVTVKNIPDNVEDLSLELLLHYYYSAEQSAAVGSEQPYIYYYLPEGINIPKDFYGPDCTVMDGGALAGYYSIDKETGLIVIRFTKDYINRKLDGNKWFEGSISFSGTISKGKNGNEDQHIDFGDASADNSWSLDVDFPNNSLEVTKTAGEIEVGSNGKIYINWKIRVQNKVAGATLDGWTLTDERFKNAVGGVQVTPLGYGTLSGDSFTFTGGTDVTFTFKEEFKSATGKLYNGSEDITAKNEATLTKPGEDEFKDDASKTLYKTSVTKNGSPDFKNGKINWEITVSNPAGLSLENYKIQDDAFKDAETKSTIKVFDKSGKEITSFHVDDNGNLILGSDVTTSEVVIRYSAEVKAGDKDNNNNVSNKATLIPPNGPQTEVTQWVKFENSFTLNKTGNFNLESKTVTWTITADSGQKGDKDINLNGYTITDDAFENLDVTDLIIESVYDGYNMKPADRNGDTSLFSLVKEDDGSYTIYHAWDNRKVGRIKLEGNTLTIYSVPDFDLDTLTFSYIQDVSNEMDQDEEEVSNEAHDGFGTSTGEIGVGLRGKEEFTKSLLGEVVDGNVIGNSTSDTVYADSFEKTLRWQVDITFEDALGGSVLIDTMASSNSRIEHYLKPDSIKVYGRDDDNSYYNGEHLVDPSKYTISYEPSTDKPTKFTITFKKNVNYTYIRIEYDTTVISTDSSDLYNQKFEISNGATFNGKKPDEEVPKYEVTVKDPKTPVTITAEKVWRESSAVTHEPIKVWLQRKTANDSTWTTIYNDGNEWKSVEADESNVYTLDQSGESRSWNDLPRFDENGNEYIYRVQEIKIPDGYNVSYSPDSDTGVKDGQKMTITNSQRPTFEKHALNPTNGNALDNGGSITKSRLEQKEWDGKNYYLLRYELKFHSPYESLWIADKLPDDCILVEQQFGNDYRPYGIWSEYTYGVINQAGNGLSSFPDSSNSIYYYDTSNNVFHVNMAKGDPVIAQYYIMIPEDKFSEDGDLELVNTAANGTDGSDSIEVTTNITSSLTPSGEKPYIKKFVQNASGSDGKFSSSGGNIRYEIYVNPEGKDLSTGNTIDLTDVLNIRKFNGIADNELLEKLTATFLNSTVTVYELVPGSVEFDAAGNVIPGTAQDIGPLDPNDFIISSQSKPYEVTTGELSLGSIDTNSDTYIDIPYPSQYQNDKVTVRLYFKAKNGVDEISNLVFQKWNTSFQIPIPTLKFENGIAYADVTFDSRFYENGQANIQILNCDGRLESITCDPTATYEHQEVNNMAKLSFRLPDGKAYRIVYEFSLSYTDGTTMTVGSEFTASNEINLQAENVSGTEDGVQANFRITESKADVSTGEITLVKHDVNNYGILLSADFYIARYDGKSNGKNKWTFATSQEEAEDEHGNVRGYTLTFPKDNNGAIIEGEGLPDSAVLVDGRIQVPATETGYGLFGLQNGYYKIIEIKAPQKDPNDPDSIDYIGCDERVAAIAPPDENGNGGDGINSLEDLLRVYLEDPDGFAGKGYSEEYNYFLDKFVAVYYFSVGTTSDLASIESPYVGDSTIKSTAEDKNLFIANSALIDVKASKAWVGDSTSDSNMVELELWWTDHVLGLDEMPNASNANFASLVDMGLGLMDEGTFHNPEFVTGNATASWRDLPSGISDRIIYYYVVERSYKTSDGKTFRRDDDDGKYYQIKTTDEYWSSDATEEDRAWEWATDAHGNKIISDFRTVYRENGMNALNKEDEMIEVVNTKGLSVEKIWRNADETTMSKPTVTSISYTLYGTNVNTNEEEILYQGTLQPNQTEEDENWKHIFPTEFIGYKDKEINLDNYTNLRVEEDEVPNGYIGSIGFNLDEDSRYGELRIINKSTDLSYTSMEVTKRWVDYVEADHSDGIKVTLYQSTVKLSDAQIKALAPNALPEGVTIYEVINEDGVPERQTDILVNAESGWKASWSNLPTKSVPENEEDEDFVPQDYYYYVTEDSVPDNYQVGYENGGTSLRQTVTITNQQIRKLTLKLSKRWDENGSEDISHQPISVNLFRTTKRGLVPSQKLTQIPLVVKINGEDANGGSYTLEQDGTLELDINKELRNDQIVSSNESVVIVENGVIKAVGAGEATITVSWEDDYGKPYSATITVTVPLEVSMNPEDGMLNVKDEATITANKAIESVSSSDPEVADVQLSPDKKSVTVTAKGAGTATITVMIDGEPHTFDVTVSDYQGFTIIGPDGQKVETNGPIYTIDQGDEITFKVLNGDFIISWCEQNNISIEPYNQWSSSGSFTVKGVNPTSYTVSFKLKYKEADGQESGEMQYTIINVNPYVPPYNFTQTTIGMKYGDELDLSEYESNGISGITYELEEGGYENNYISLTPDGHVTAKSTKGSANVIASYYDAEKNKHCTVKLTINVTDPNATFENPCHVYPNMTLYSEQSPMDITLDSLGVEYKNYIKKVELVFSGNPISENSVCFFGEAGSDVWINKSATGNTLTFSGTSDVPFPSPLIGIRAYCYWNTFTLAEVIITYDETAMASLSNNVSRKLSLNSKYPVSPLMSLPEGAKWEKDGDIEYVTKPFKIGETGIGWSIDIDNLDVRDENGDIYYYWVEEVHVTGYETTYTYIDGDKDYKYGINADKPGAGEIEILNTRTDNPETTMPSTGGTGTRGYTAAGATIIIASAGVLLMKRKRRDPTYDPP